MECHSRVLNVAHLSQTPPNLWRHRSRTQNESCESWEPQHHVLTTQTSVANPVKWVNFYRSRSRWWEKWGLRTPLFALDALVLFIPMSLSFFSSFLEVLIRTTSPPNIVVLYSWFDLFSSRPSPYDLTECIPTKGHPLQQFFPNDFRIRNPQHLFGDTVISHRMWLVFLPTCASWTANFFRRKASPKNSTRVFDDSQFSLVCFFCEVIRKKRRRKNQRAKKRRNQRKKRRSNTCQVIQAVTFLIPKRWVGHVFTIPKRSPAELPGGGSFTQ